MQDGLHKQLMQLAAWCIVGLVWPTISAGVADAAPAAIEVNFSEGNGPVAAAQHSQLIGLAAKGKARMIGVPLDESGTTAVTLNLERFTVFADDAQVVVQHGTTQEIHSPPPSAHYRGEVEGYPGSKAFVSVAADGSIRSVLHIGPDLVITERGRPESGSAIAVGRRIDPQHDFAQRSFACSADPDLGRVSGASPAAASLLNPAQGVPTSGAMSMPPTAALTSTYYNATIAFETDVEFLQQFGNDQAAATQYIADLIGYISSVYNTEVKVNLLVGNVYLYTTASYPWNAAPSTDSALTSLRTYWTSGARTGVSRAVTHLLSGQSLGGGIAYGGVLCNASYGYGVSADISGQFNASNPQLVWDAVVVAHELGHNFGSPHTHAYDNTESVANPVDCCYSDGPGVCAAYSTNYPLPSAGSLTGGTSGTGAGTIMSYCHTRSGGLSNLSFTFGQSHTIGVSPGRVPIVMRKHVEATVVATPSCLPATTPPTAPAAPTIGAASAGNARIFVSFTAPTENGGQPITGYTATCTPTGGGAGVSSSGTASPIAVTGLTNGTSYTCTVTATNSVGTSPASSASNSATPSLAAVYSGTVGSSFAGNRYSGSYYGNMFNLTTLTGHVTVNRFDIHLNATAGTQVPVSVYSRTGSYVGAETSAGSWTLRGTYTVTSAGTGSPSAMPVTPFSLASGATHGIYITATNGTSLYFSTNLPTTTSNSDVQLTFGAAVSYPFGNGLPGYIWNGTVYYEVAISVPGAPTIGTATAGNGQASVSFTAPASNGGAAITGYTAGCTPNGGGGTVSAGGTLSPIVVTGLTNGTTYQCRVTATNSAGTGPASSSATVTPSAPVNGSCGSANGVLTTTAPTTGLCATGTASAVSRVGDNWSWSCAGLSGGTNANCQAPAIAARSITLGSTANPSTVGQYVTYTAVVTGAYGTPTGTIVFLDNGNVINGCGGLVMSNGRASCTIGNQALGTHSMTAVYSGNTTYLGITSSTLPQVVNPAKANTPSITLGSSVNPSTVGQYVELTAVVSGGAGTPTGTLVFRDNGDTISGCGGLPLTNGKATCTPGNLALGSHSITTVYSGDGTYNGVTSSTLPQTVGAAKAYTPSFTLGSSQNPSTAGNVVTFTAILSGAAGAPTGKVVFRDNSVTISGCGGLVLSSGQVSCSPRLNTVGTHSITGIYLGDTNYNGITSSALPQVMQ